MVPKAVRNRVRPGPLLSSGLPQRSQLRCRARKLAAWAETTPPWMLASTAFFVERQTDHLQPVVALVEMQDLALADHAVVVGHDPDLDLNTHALVPKAAT